MAISNFESFNEGIFNLNKIKEEAKKFIQTKECREILSSVDNSLIDSSVKELTKLKEKWGSIDILSNKLITKANSKNEGVGSIIVLSMFGIHAFMKLLVALKHNKSFLQYIGRLFYSDDELKTLRDIIIMAIFIVYSIAYIVQTKTYTKDTYLNYNNSIMVNLNFKWNGIHNYIFVDNFNKKYDIIRTSGGKYDILYKGEKIGIYDKSNIYRLSGELVFNSSTEETAVAIANSIVKIDLEKKLKSKKNPKLQADIESKISKREKEIEKLNKEIDSINKISVYENLDIAKKVLKDAGRNYDEIISGKTEMDIRDKKFLYIKDQLTKNNNIGYLGLLTNIIYNDPNWMKIKYSDIEYLYKMIMENTDIISKLRDNNGELTTLSDLKTFENIEDALKRLDDWRIVNKFMREVPSSQRRLIWNNGYFINELKDSFGFLTQSIVKISKDATLSRLFLSKISAIKSKEGIINSITRIINDNPWSFDFWLQKLEDTRGVYITWSSKEEKQIIFLVSTYDSMKKVAYMTNWCIARDIDYFRSYSKNGFQFILYDFNYPKTSNRSVIGFSLNHKSIQNKITNCHDKNDYSVMIPEKFIEKITHGYDRGYLINGKYITINIIKAIKKLDTTFIKFLKIKLNRFLNKPAISSFIDFYDDGYY